MDLWDGGQATQLAWFLQRLRLAEESHEFKLLVESATALITQSGTIAVFSPKHALEHASGKNKGTFAKPNMRAREDLSGLISTTSSTSTTSATSPSVHGGFPTVPTPSTIASAASRTQTLLRNEVGDLAETYRISPDTIEKVDNQFLNHFIDNMKTDRLREVWRRKCPTGRKFVVEFKKSIDANALSLTANDTIDARMRIILSNGLEDATYASYLEMVGAYEDLNEVRMHPFTDQQLAHEYKNAVCKLSDSIENKLLLRLSILESAAAARGENPARDTPVELINEAVSIVLEDAANREILNSLAGKNGNVFNAKKFDPARNLRDRPNVNDPNWKYTGPDKWIEGMRPCVFCKSLSISEKDKMHPDLKCPRATEEQKEALIQERTAAAKAKRQRRRSQNSGTGTGGNNGGARMVKADAAIDQQDADNANEIFNSGQPTLVELDQLIDGEQATSSAAKHGHSLMVSSLSRPMLGRLAPTHSPVNGDWSRHHAPATGNSSTGCSTLPTSVAGSTNYASSVASSARPSVPNTDPVDESICVYVVTGSGNSISDEVIPGVYVGHWKKEVRPYVQTKYSKELPNIHFDKGLLTQRTSRVIDLEAAVCKCDAAGVEPIFRGPKALEHQGHTLQVNECLAAFLLNIQDGSGSESSSPTLSRDGGGSDAEPQLDVTPAESTRTKLNEPRQIHAQQTYPTSEQDAIDAAMSDATADVEALTVNSHVDLIRTVIRRHGLCIGGNPISPGTGGPTGRTKIAMLQEARFAVGLDRLPDSELRQRRKRPDVPMGTPIEDPSNDTGRKLDFEPTTNAQSEVPAGYATSSLLLALVFVAQMLMVGMVLIMNGHYVPCRSFLPMPICEALGYTNTINLSQPALAASATAPTTLDDPAIDGFVRDPGALARAEVGGGGAHYGGAHGFGALPHLALPCSLCLLLLLHSLWITIGFTCSVLVRLSSYVFDPQAKPGSQGLGHPNDPPRDTRYRTRRTTSVFWRTLGHAPLWLSVLFLAYEIATRVVPSLAALSIATLVLPLVRIVHAGMSHVYSHPLATPARVTARFSFNFIVVLLYLAHAAIDGVFLSKQTAWPPPLADHAASSTTLGPRFARAHELSRVLLTDMSRWGGAALSHLFLRLPSPTDPSVINYQVDPSLSAPRALHAFNPKLHASHRNQLTDEKNNGRAFLGRGNKPKPFTTKNLSAATSQIDKLKSLLCWAVIDSGCSWHCHPTESDLVNRRKCNDTMTGIDGKPRPVTCIGDLPILVRDRHGVWTHCTIRNVRCVPFFTDTLISVDQFWEDSKVDCTFNQVRCIHVPARGDLPSIDLPFRRLDNLFRWAILPVRRHGGLESVPTSPAGARAMKASIHRAKSSSFFNTLPADEQLRMLHRRLHVSHNLIRRLGRSSADVPESIQRGKSHDCEHCKVANATRVPHNGKAYRPSHVGRLIHADIAGPFRRSHHGFLYFLVLVDDHSRFKAVYFLKRKSEALARVRAFVTKLNALASRGKPEPVRVVGQLQMDNAGEFLSRDFDEFLDEESIVRTTCPPHVHQLNGVAERAIRSIMEVVRATREASQCPIGFWPHLVEHAVDVLNRTTGPPRGDFDSVHDSNSEYELTSYELVIGEPAKILTILPLGCRAYAVKPVGSFSKSEMEPRGWSGINLGKSSTIPGAYNIWLPIEGKIIQTSEVYFDESLYPWRPKGDQRLGDPAPVAAPRESPTEASISDDAISPKGAATTNPQSSNEVPSSSKARATSRTSNRLLLLFSGSYQRPDGIAQFARQLGLEVDLFDSDPDVGGGPNADILCDKVYESLQDRIQAGTYVAIFAAPPCSTYSISRFFRSSSAKDGGPPPVRTRQEIDGCRFLPQKHHEELRRANTITARMSALLILAHRAGTDFVIENPADRGDASKPDLFIDEKHGPLWLVGSICALAKMATTSTVTFAMCAFGAPWQKMTTLMYTPGLASWFDPLRERKCSHSSHEEIAGGKKRNGTWNSTDAAAYPPDFNSYVAQSIASLVRQRQSLDPKASPEVELPTPNHLPEAPRLINPSKAVTQSLRDESTTHVTEIEKAHTPQHAGVTLVDRADEADRKFKSTLSSLEDATSIRALSFDDVGEENEERPILEAPVQIDAPQPRPKRKVTFEKTAGARGTRSQNVPLVRGIGTSDGFAMLSLGASLPTAVYAMGTTDVFGELSRPGGTLRAALAKPSATDPKTQAEAYRMDKPNWVKSEMKELKNHEDNGSWEYIPASMLPRGRRLVKMVWVYKIKRDGTYKSRLCVQGCRQVAGVDYDQTWCGAMRGTSLRLLANLAANSGMRMRRHDFVAAYLQGELLEGETVYCYPPSGYEKCDADGRPMICKILKPVYGMAQAGRRWQRTLFPWLKEFGFTQTQSDQSVFTLERTMSTPDGPRLERLHVGVYVDDLATVYLQDDEHSLYQSFVTALRARWNIEDEGDLTDLLGIEFTREGKYIELRQTKYIEKLAHEFFPNGVPPTAQANKVPCDRGLPSLVHLALLDGATPDPTLLKKYQSLCGALLYASTNTRPDIAFATGMLCRAMGRPTPELYEAALRVLGYLYRNRQIGLRYEASGQSLEGYSDSDWAVKHSTSGYSFHLGSATISWASKKQTTVALSSCEAEIMAGSEAAKEAIYLSGFLKELGSNLNEPPPLKMDNKSAIDLSYNPEHHSKTKHIERRHYFIRECVEDGKLRVPFVPSHENVADFFTKPLMGKHFFALRDKVMHLPHPSRANPDDAPP